MAPPRRYVKRYGLLGVVGEGAWADGCQVMASLDERARQELAEASAFANFGHLVGWIERTHGLPFNGAVVRW